MQPRSASHPVPVREAHRRSARIALPGRPYHRDRSSQVYLEGEPATCFYVLIEGEVVLSKLSGGEDIEINRTTQRGVYSGGWTAYLGDRVPQVYAGSMRVTTPSTFFVLDADKFGNAMREWFPMAVHLLEGVFFGKKNTQQIIDQRERLLALGSLSAGLTHELNNPAAAAVRATASLRERVAGMRHKLGMVASGTYDRDALVTLMRLQEEVAEVVAKAPTSLPSKPLIERIHWENGSRIIRFEKVGTWLRPSCRLDSTPLGSRTLLQPLTSPYSKAQFAG